MESAWIAAGAAAPLGAERGTPLPSAPLGTPAHLTPLPDQAVRLAEGDAGYIADFISAAEESELASVIDRQDWITDLRRRVQHYGYRYDYSKRDLTDDDRIGPLPGWVMEVCDRLVRQGVFESHPDQLIVNEYVPPQGIVPHTDRGCFGEVVASLSLLSDYVMDLYPNPRDKERKFPIVLERCSLLVLRGAARHQWRHGISARKSDTQPSRCDSDQSGPQKFPRHRRLSLTFRTVPRTRP